MIILRVINMNKLIWAAVILISLSVGCRWYPYISPTRDANSINKQKEIQKNHKPYQCTTCK